MAIRLRYLNKYRKRNLTRMRNQFRRRAALARGCSSKRARGEFNWWDTLGNVAGIAAKVIPFLL